MLIDLQKLTLYHGSYIEVKIPTLSFSQKGNDFGKGFYLTANRDNAIEYAKRAMHRNSQSTCIVNTYTLSDLQSLESDILKEIDENWLNLILGNIDDRFHFLSKKYDHYDVLVGPTLEGRIAGFIKTIFNGMYGDISLQETRDFIISVWVAHMTQEQICFKTDKSLEKITFIDSEEIKWKN